MTIITMCNRRFFEPGKIFWNLFGRVRSNLKINEQDAVVMRRLRCAFIMITAVFLPWVSVLAQGYNFEAAVDREEVGFGESLTLALTISASLSGFSQPRISAPSVDSIPGFEIVGRRSSQNMSFVNGVGQLQIQTLYELVPQQPGEQVIPSFSLQAPDGNVYTTDPITVKVQPPTPPAAPQEHSQPGSSYNPQTHGGMSFFRGLLLIAVFTLIVLAIPVVLTIFLKAGKSGKPAKAAPAEYDYSSDPIKKSVDISDAELMTPMDNLPLEAEKQKNFEFKEAYQKLCSRFLERNLEFFRSFFDLFREGLLISHSKIEAEMTPEEMISVLKKSLSSQLRMTIVRIGEDWEMVAYANTPPSRSIDELYFDSAEVISAIPLQERRS